MKATPASASRFSARHPRHPRIWQLQEVPCWDRILLEIFEEPKPACMGYVSTSSPHLLYLNMSSSPDGEQIYDIVHRDVGTEEHFLLEVLYIKLRSFDALGWTRSRLSRLLLEHPSSHATSIGVTVESPAEHRARARCPFCCCFDRPPLETPPADPSPRVRNGVPLLPSRGGEEREVTSEDVKKLMQGEEE